MKSMMRLLLVASVLAITGLGFSAVQAAEKGPAKAKQDKAPAQEQWRYTFHNSEWWYWMPANRWVYWRNNRWNDYNPQTYVSPGAMGVVAGYPTGWNNGSSTDINSDNRPFYGHATSGLDRRPLERNGEAGPFYGRALPSEVFEGLRSRDSSRPFYGHAIPSGD
jgi:hypothetical protein